MWMLIRRVGETVMIGGRDKIAGPVVLPSTADLRGVRNCLPGAGFGSGVAKYRIP